MQTSAPLPVLRGWVTLQLPPSLLNASRVSVVHFFVPSPLKTRSTFHCEPAELSMLAVADSRSRPSTLATSSMYFWFPPASQATACLVMSSMLPAGRLFSVSQVLSGTLNWMCGGCHSTSCGVCLRNCSRPWCVASSICVGSWICWAAAIAEVPSLARMSCWILATSTEPDGLAEGLAVPLGVAVAAGVGVGVGVAEALGLVLGLALGLPLAEPLAEGEGDGVAVVGRSVVAARTLRKRSSAVAPSWRIESLFWPGAEITIWS